MENIIKELAEAIYDLKEVSPCLVEEAQGSLHLLAQGGIQENNPDSVVYNRADIYAIRNSLKAIVDLTDWIDEVQARLEKVRRELARELSA